MRIERTERTSVGLERFAAVAVLLPVLVTLAACDLGDILAVDTPGQVLEEDLGNPELAATLMESVISDVECSWNQYVAGSALHSDEYLQSSGNLTMRNWGQRRILSDDAGFAQGTCGGWGFPMYTPLHTARFQANDVFDRLASEEFADVEGREEMMATVRAFGAFPLVALGEGFCEMTIPPEEGTPGPLMEPSEVLRLAEETFTEAIALAEQVGSDDIRHMALVGRARARLNLEDFEGTIADASQVPPGFLQVATRDASDVRRYNYYYERINATDGFREHGSIAPHYRDLTIAADGRPTQEDGVADPRVNAMTNGDLAANFATIHWFHDKYSSRSDPVPLASYREAQLFIAEAAARTGDLATPLQIINDRRAELDLPTVEYELDQTGMMELILEERRRELFVEGAHRLNDMLRFRGTEFEIPFLGEPGSIHPDGRDQTGAAYGPTTCFPLPDVERDGNPNL